MGVKLVRTDIRDSSVASQTLREEGYRVYLWSDEPGTFYPTHTHPDYEVRWIIEGEVIIGVGNEEFLLKPGDRIELEPNTPHWAKTDRGVVYVCGSK
jgi:quercetin dioxygenase-like cupin family protein